MALNLSSQYFPQNFIQFLNNHTNFGRLEFDINFQCQSMSVKTDIHKSLSQRHILVTILIVFGRI